MDGAVREPMALGSKGEEGIHQPEVPLESGCPILQHSHNIGLAPLFLDPRIVLLSSHPPLQSGTYYVCVLSLCKDAGTMKVWTVFPGKEAVTLPWPCFHTENGDKSRLWVVKGSQLSICKPPISSLQCGKKKA